MIIKQIRTVKLQDYNAKKRYGRNNSIYGYTTEDLSRLFNVTTESIRNMISAKLLDPTSIESITKLYMHRFKEPTHQSQ